MILNRRHPRSRRQKIRQFLWPSMGWRRLALYYRHRLGRLPGTPYFIASGFATGIAISFTPFMGFHLMLAGVITWILRGSLVAMVLGTVIAGNPWTFPFIWVTTFRLGKSMMGVHDFNSPATLAGHFTLTDLMDKPMELLLPMTLGSLPLVLLSWFLSFHFARRLVKRYKNIRYARIHNIR